MRIISLLLLLSFATLCYSSDADCVNDALTANGFCARKWATGLRRPRGILVLPNNDVLVVEVGRSQITLFYETTELNKVILATAKDLSHSVAYGGGYLYASSETTVYRWPYTLGTRTALGTPETVITGIPTGHGSRTMVFVNDTIIMNVGSDGNLDASGRPGIHRYQVSSFPTTFASRTIVAGGTRNEVGLRIDPSGRLWGVENGVDNLNRPDLGVNIHNQNPGEEVNLFDQEGGFYGYPYCWTKFNITTVNTPWLTQYAHPQYMNDGTHTDAWCQNTNNVVPPKYALRGHTAPLDIIFYDAKTDFPSEVGNAFVALHGSWNRDPPAGYSVVQLHFENGLPTSESNMLAYRGPGEFKTGWLRPVALGWYTVGGHTRLLITDDTNNLIVALDYNTSCTCTSAVSSATSLGILPAISFVAILVSLLLL